MTLALLSLIPWGQFHFNVHKLEQCIKPPLLIKTRKCGFCLQHYHLPRTELIYSYSFAGNGGTDNSMYVGGSEGVPGKCMYVCILHTVYFQSKVQKFKTLSSPLFLLLQKKEENPNLYTQKCHLGLFLRSTTFFLRSAIISPLPILEFCCV